MARSSPIFKMEILLVYREQKLGEEFNNKFSCETGVKILKGDICSLVCDAIASPGNSKGDMGGGLDLAVRKRLGPGIEDKLKAKINSRFAGRIPVGEAVVLPTGDPLIPWLISAPTMIEPGDIRGTRNAEKAMLAILREAKKNEEIKKIAIPGLGTGVGGLSAKGAVSQMWSGYKKFKSWAGEKNENQI